jgi:hypothetical protein
MDYATPLEYVLEKFENEKLPYVDQVQLGLFKVLLKQLDALSWPSFIAQAMLSMTDPAFDFVVNCGKDLATKLVEHPYVDPKPFVNVLNLCQSTFWHYSEMRDVINSVEIARFDAHSGRKFVFKSTI